MLQSTLEIFFFGIKYGAIFILIPAFLVLLVMLILPALGGLTNKKSRRNIPLSAHYNGILFKNIEPTSLKLYKVDTEPKFKIIDFLFPPKKTLRNPSEPLPTVKLNKNNLKNGDFVWLGHSTALFVTGDKTIMFDPVYGNASPILCTITPFNTTQLLSIEDLPKIDAILISHDHYDHLDHTTIKKIKGKTQHFYVPIGIKPHLLRWGVSEQSITELDWYENATLGTITFTLTPSRHYSGRGIFLKNKSLWGSWVVQSPTLSLFYSGDSGYGKHFSEIAARFGPFDIALIENGQYNLRWKDVHMLPKQSVKAATDIQAQYILPIHWGKFVLALHTWKEPIENFIAEAGTKSFTLLVPQIGEIFTLQNPPTIESKGKWWEHIK